MKYMEYDETDIQSLEYETTIVSDGNIVGTCELGKATIQMLNDSNEYSLLKGLWIKTNHGSFYINDIKPVQEKVNIKLECYDIKYKLDKPYDSSKHTFPCMLKEWRNSIFDDCEVEYDNSDFPNSDLVLETEPYIGENPSNRNVICQIAQAGMSFVVTDKEDRFYFNWFDDVVHNATDWSSLTTEKDYSKPVNVMVLGRGDTEDNVRFPEILPDDPFEFRIDSNYILDSQSTSETTDQRYNVIKPLYDRISGFSYLIFQIKTQNIKDKLTVMLGQKVQFLDIWDNNLNGYIMTKKITYLGGNMLDDDNYEVMLSASEIKETSTEYSYSSSTENRVLRVERKADKISGEIEDVILEVDGQNEKLVQMTMDVNSMNTKVQEVSNDLDATKTETADLKMTVNEISSAVQIGGGTNMLQNSVGLYGMDGVKVENNRFYFMPVNNLIVGETYTLTFKYSNEVNNSVRVILDNVNEEEILTSNETVGLDEVVYTFIAKDTTVQLIIEMADSFDVLSGKVTQLIGRTISEAGFILTDTELNRSFLITDTIFRKSLTRSDWEPANGEILGTTLSVYYNGIEISSASADIKTKINNMGFVVTNNYDQIVLSITKDFVLLTNTKIDGDLYIKTTYLKEIIINGDRHLVIGGDSR